jgi:tRNA(Ile)-lysidine synthase
LVAVSGGMDSMVLLHVLVRLMPRLGFRLHVAHIHHGLRRRSAEQDAAFVSAEGRKYGVPVRVERLAPEQRLPGTSVQVWAREARYARLEAVRQRVRAAWVLTGHTQNDQAETVLLNLLRGTGPRGLAGIPEIRERVLRPMLGISRAEIAAYAATNTVRFREDPSNRSLVYRRNHIRHQLLPLLARQYNPQIVSTLAALAVQAREDDDALGSQAAAVARRLFRRRGSAVGLDVSRGRLPSPAVGRRLLQEAFRQVSTGRHALTRRHVAALGKLTAGPGRVMLPGGFEAWRSAEILWIGPTASVTARSRRSGARRGRNDDTPPLHVRPGEWVRWEPGRCALRVHRMAKAAMALQPDNPQREILSPTVLEERLSLRSWQAGDRFQPLGLRGTKKLQDFFVDAKVPRTERDKVPLLVAGDRIVWVVGHRISDAFRWRGETVVCLAEVKPWERRHGVPTRSDTAVGG